MTKRKASLGIGLVVATLLAGGAVVFLVLILSSALGLPWWGAIGFATFGAALILYPVFRPLHDPPSDTSAEGDE